MAQPPTGLLGDLLVRRPLLANSIIGFGATALAAVGIRQAGNIGGLIDIALMAALVGVVFPAGVAALGAGRGPVRVGVFSIAALLICGLIFFGDALPFRPDALGSGLILSLSLFLLIFFFLARFLAGGAVALSAAAPLGAVLGAAGGVGYLAIQTRENLMEPGLIFALALAIGASVGFGIAVDFSRFFARGDAHLRAAAAAGHAAIAPSVFSILTGAAFFAVNSFNANSNIVNWSALWVGFAILVMALAASIAAVVGSLALSPPSEQNAVDENHRQRSFAKVWKPVRLAAPPATAAAVVAIAAVFALIAVFEAGAQNMWSTAALFLLIWIAAGVCFVSLRAAIFIVLLLSLAVFLTNYVYAIGGMGIPTLSEKLLALTLLAIALGHLTVGWRDAGDEWRRASDVAENALSDGAGRFVYAVVIAIASLLVSSAALSWTEGYGAARYLGASALFVAILAPPMMIAFSARLLGGADQYDADV